MTAYQHAQLAPLHMGEGVGPLGLQAAGQMLGKRGHAHGEQTAQRGVDRHLGGQIQKAA